MAEGASGGEGGVMITTPENIRINNKEDYK